MITQKNSRGFTLIELIVVILILGILSVVAAPRFISVQDDVHKNVVADTAKKFSSAVDLFKIQWISNGHTGATDNVAGFGLNNVDAGADGWPTGVTDAVTTLTNDECNALFNALLKDGDAGATNDFTWDGLFNSGQCVFFYRPDTPTIRRFNYNPTTGEITNIINP